MKTKTFFTYNPTNGQKICSFSFESWPQVQKKLALVRGGFESWKKVSLKERAELLQNLAPILREYSHEAALVMATEMGKPLREGRSEIEKCAWSAEVLAKKGAKWLADETHQDEREQDGTLDGKKHLTIFEPLGVILGVMPWNFPFWQVFRFAIPTLLAGNTVLLKHADNVSGCSELIQWIMEKAGLPAEVFQNIICDHVTAQKLIAHDGISGVSLTGSVRAGQAIGATAGAHLKRVVMELGGSDPFIVLADADIDKAALALSQGRFGNCGQSCVAPKRVIIEEKIYKKFVDTFLNLVKTKKVGDPILDSTDMGPMVSKNAVAIVKKQLDLSVKQGAKILWQGQIPKGQGAFYPPTILENVTHTMPVFKEEVFGPVVSLIKAHNETQIECLAFHPDFGLGSSIWTQNREKGERLARKMQSGLAFVNSLPKSDPHLSFGGIKKSGLGHELGVLGIRSFVNQKNLSVY